MTGIELLGDKLKAFIYHPHPTPNERLDAEKTLNEILHISDRLGVVTKS